MAESLSPAKEHQHCDSYLAALAVSVLMSAFPYKEEEIRFCSNKLARTQTVKVNIKSLVTIFVFFPKLLDSLTTPIHQYQVSILYSYDPRKSIGSHQIVVISMQQQPSLRSGLWKHICFCKKGDVLDESLTVCRACKSKIKCNHNVTNLTNFYTPTEMPWDC